MAEVAIAIPVIWNKTTCEADEFRRNSTGKIADKTNEVKVLPNYLRASLGSCHDYCKFGFKPEFKTIEWTPMVKISKTSPRCETSQKKIGLEPAKGENLEKQKSSFKVSRPASNLGNSIQSSRTKRTVTSNNPEELKQKPFRTKESSIETAHQLRRNSEVNIPKGTSNSGLTEGNDSTNGIGTSKGSKKTYMLPTTCSRSHKIDREKITKPKEISRTKRNENTGTLSASQSRARKPNAQSISKEISHLNSKVVLENADTEQPSAENIPEKILYITELNTKSCEGLSPERSDGLTEKQASKIEDVSLIQGHIDTIHHSPSSLSLCSDSKASSSSTLMSLLSSSSATKFAKKKKHAGKDHSEDGNCSPRKQKFRKGKSNIEIPSGIKSPRRLKFRQGNIAISESQSKYAETKRKKSYRKTDIGVESRTTRNELNEVVLRRQN
nr:uncharacterized protein LOC113741013 [Coffea arabica]